MIKVHTFLDNKIKSSYLPLLYPNFGHINKETRPYFERAVKAINKPIFEIVPNLEQADFFLIPYEFFSIEGEKEYISKYIELSKKHGKKVITFDFSDHDKEISMPNSIILRTSQYKYKKKENEFIIPPLVEDLALNSKITLREKSNKPIVGFNGWAGFKSAKARLKFLVKNILQDLKSVYDSQASIHKQGIYFRRKIIELLERSHLVETNFMIRKSYSAHVDTIELSPDIARKEYVENILNSDFTICPKGDGNYSNRFYEVLSLGRIPILIDTEMMLPLEEKIDYSKFVLRVKYKDINKLDEIISQFYHSLSGKEFKEMQQVARDSFIKYFLPNVFYEKLFENISK